MKKIGLILALAAACVCGGALRAEDKAAKPVPGSMNLDGFEANDWSPVFAEGTTMSTKVLPGKDGKALDISYDLKETKQWVQISKEFNLPLEGIEGKAVQFSYKAAGQKTNNLEIKLVDADGSNFGKKIPVKSSDWQTVTFELSDFAYWWGGDAKLDGVQKIFFAVSATDGGPGVVTLDDLKLVPSKIKMPEKLKSGMIDDCETAASWKVEKDKGSEVTIASVPGKKQQGVGIGYDLGSGKWVQLHKDVELEVSDEQKIRMHVKWAGENVGFEVKLVDKDGSTFGKKISFAELGKEGQWSELVVPVSSLTYFWGGDKQLDKKNVTALWFAVSSEAGGKGSVAVDQIELVK